MSGTDQTAETDAAQSRKRKREDSSKREGADTSASSDTSASTAGSDVGGPTNVGDTMGVRTRSLTFELPLDQSASAAKEVVDGRRWIRGPLTSYVTFPASKMVASAAQASLRAGALETEWIEVLARNIDQPHRYHAGRLDNCYPTRGLASRIIRGAVP